MLLIKKICIYSIIKIIKLHNKKNIVFISIKINLIITQSFPKEISKKMFNFYKYTPEDKLKVLKDINSEIVECAESLLESLSKF